MSDTVRALKPLRDEQARASAPDSHVWLSASAGTGKTHVLTARVFRLLLSDVAPERILCLTFTKAGAAEMANRVHERLAAWVRMPGTEVAGDLIALGEDHGPDAVARARLLFARVLEATGGGLKIQTIHSFCQTLLGAFPMEAGLIPGFQPLDERGQAELARETLVGLVLDAEAQGNRQLLDCLAALSLRLGEGDTERYLMRCATRHDTLKLLPDEIVPFVRDRLSLPDGAAGDLLMDACSDSVFDAASLSALARANAAWGTATGLKAADAAASWLAASPDARVSRLDEVASVVLTKDGKPRAVSKKLLEAEPGYPDYAQRVIDSVQSVMALRAGLTYADLVAQALDAGRAFANAYASAKRSRGAVDFDDLIAWTVGLLRETDMADWIRYKLDQGIDHILVDEAQDTNRDQWRIVDALAEEFFALDPDGTERPRTLFVVGDDKQAIFGFQGTSPDAFRLAKTGFSARALIAGQPFADLPLSESFRSTPAVLEVVDAMLDTLGPEAIGLVDRPPAHLSARQLPGQVLLWAPTRVGAAEDGEGEEGDPDGDEDWLADHVRLHASRIAQQIRLWLNPASPMMLAAKGRPVRAGDIMILVRSRSDLSRLIVARLYEEGVPIAGIDRLRLQAPLAVRDLLAALRFVVQPHDDLNLANLLVSPLIGWDQERLMNAAIRHGGVGLWEHLRSRETESALAPLRALLAGADLTTPYRFLERILSGPMAGRRALLARLGPEAGDAIDELLNAALAFEAADSPSLQHFIDWFDRGDGEIKRELGEGGDAVRVLTVHGSKGLQAPVVILADATFNPVDQQRDIAVAVPLADDDAADGHELPFLMPRKTEQSGPIGAAVDGWRARELREHWRLLYVAMTRAEDVLAVGGYLSPRAKGRLPDASWHKCVGEALSTLGAGGRPSDIWGEEIFWLGVDDLPAARAERTGGRPEEQPGELPDWIFAPAPQEARPPRPLAPSAPTDDDQPYPPPSPAQRAAAARGTAIHGLFERLPSVLSPDERYIAADRWLERQAGMSDMAQRKQMIDEVLAVIEHPDFAALFGPAALAEVPITATVDAVVIAGTIDRMLVESGRILLVDFKTGSRVPTDPADVPPSHVRQMAAYAAAAAVIFPDHRIEAALLYSAEPRLVMLDPELLARCKPGLTGP